MTKVEHPEAKVSWEKIAGVTRLSLDDRATRIEYIDWKRITNESREIQIVWLGHASFLIVWRGKRILFDPNFSRTVGVMPRRCPIPLGWKDLRPDAIVISHAHMDHLDTRTLARFRKTPIYLPDKSERFLSDSLQTYAVPMRLGERVTLGELELRSVSAKHGGWRFPWQHGHRAFGYVLSDGARALYFAGDTAYGNHFEEIASQYSIDWALLPIGAYAPRWFLKSRHMNPEEAILAFEDLKADQMIPYHFGSYRLSWERLEEPLRRFADLAKRKKIRWRVPVGF